MLNEYNFRRGILQVLMLLLGLGAFAQDKVNYRGVVTSSEEPVPQVEIVFLETGEVLGYTDSSGNYSISLSGLPAVQFRKTGYSTLNTSLHEGDQRIQLLKEVVLLDRIVISETRRLTQVKRSTVTIDLIQPDLIDQTAPLNVEKSINRVNGAPKGFERISASRFTRAPLGPDSWT